MVFSSIPAYLDPSNWHQQQNHQNIIGSSGTNTLLPPPPQPQQRPQSAPPQPHGGGPGSIRPGSMSERARMANIPMPETALKCPRCESTNTKFCYFNNYSLSQPRHFCKTCRRYWTRGGALRNVPVGGGCRRNKRSKSSSSKSSPASSERQTTTTNNNNKNPSAASTSTISTNTGLGLTPPQFPPLRFMSPLGQLMTDNFGAGGDHMGLNYGGIGAAPPANEMNYHGGVGSLLSGDGGIESWRMQQQVQQFPFFGGLDQSSSPLPAANNINMYQFYGGESGFMGGGHQMRPMKPSNNNNNSSLMLSSSQSVKMEDHQNPDQINLSRQLLGGMQGNQDQQWNSTPPNWTELSSFSSSSTSNPA